MKDKLLKLEKVLVKIPSQLKNLYHNLINHIQSSYKKMQDLSATNYNLGIHHLNLGNIRDAKLRFLIASKLKPNNALAHYHLARCYIFDLNTEKAKDALKTTLSLSPNLIKAEYRLSLINNNLTNIKPPIEVVKEDYNTLASKYEEHLLDQKKYEAPELLVTSLSEFIKEDHSILDLGCGTGLVGAHLAQLTKFKSLVGIDISENMLNLAKELNIRNIPIYNKTLTLDLNHLEKLQDSFDVVISCRAFDYIDDLSDLFKGLNHTCNKGAFLGIAVLKSSNDTNNFDYEESAIAHSSKTLKQIFKNFKWEILKSEEINIYTNNTPGLLFILKKN